MLNFKNEYYLLEKGRVLYPTAFTDLVSIEVYGSKEGGVTGTEDTAHVFKIPNNYYTLNAGNIDFSNYPDKIENDFKSIKIVNIENLISLPVNFNEWKDITPDNLKVTFEKLGLSVKDVQKRLSEVGLYIDSNLPGEIGLPKLPVGCTWYCNQDGHITAIPINDLYGKFNQMIEHLKKILEEYATERGLLSKGIIHEIHQPNHGFIFEPITYDNGVWRKADISTSADGMGVIKDNDKFYFVEAGEIEVPKDALDKDGQEILEDEYYYLNENGVGLQREEPLYYYQPILHTRRVKGKLVADVNIETMEDLRSQVVDTDTIHEHGLATLNDIPQTFDTIARLQKSFWLREGQVVEVLGYYEAGDGANHKRIIASEDDGSGVQLANGLWANIVHNGEVNVSWFGALFDTQYNLEKAKKNYYIVQKFFDYAPKAKKLIFDGKGVLSLIGSHHLSTDGAYLLIETGCDVKGKYNEGQNGVYYQGGHMIGIGKPRHPKPPFDWHSELIKDVTVELNGTLETLYDNFSGTVTQDHNNNCIGVGVAFNVKVIGTGGVVGSDHKGICFDNACWGCTLDISFIKNCYHYPWNMSADFPIYGFEQSEFEKYKNYRNYVRVRKNIIDLNLIDPSNYEIVRIYEGNILVEDCEFIFLNEPKDRCILGFRVHKSNFEGRNITFSSNQTISEVFAVDTHKNFILENSSFTNPKKLVKIKSLDTEFEDIRLNNINVYGNCEVIVENSTSTKIDFLLDKCNFLGINSNYEITNGAKELATSTIYGCKIDYSKIKYRKKRNKSLEESLILDIQNENTILIDRNKNFNYTNISLTISTKEHDAERQIINIPLELLGITKKKLIIKYPDFTNQIKKISLVEDDAGNTITITSELNEIISYAVMW